MRGYFLRLYLLLAVGNVLSNAIYYILNPTSSNSYFSGTALYNGRFRGWGVNPNDLASSLAMLYIPVLWYSIQTQRSKPAKYGLAVIFLIALVQLIATGSRAGILSGIIALLILLLGRRDWTSRVVIIFVITLALGTIYFANPTNNILKRFVYRNETTLQGSGRLTAWNRTIVQFKSRPVLGFGLGVSNPEGNISGLVFSLRSYALQVANSYLSILQELGMIGFTIFILMLFIPTLKGCWIEFSKFDCPIERSRLVFVASVCAGLFNVLFEGWLFSVGTLYCVSFWLFASFIVEKDDIQTTQISHS
jgi:O-antigen ligase